MSASPNDHQDDPADKQSVDELDANHTPDDPEPGSSATPAKRGRGRPKGSKNKKSGASGPDSPSTPTVPRKRGRPPKEKKPEDAEEPTPKRPRGRPPKNPKPAAPAEGDASDPNAEASTPAPKKKRGRPPKKVAAQ